MMNAEATVVDNAASRRFEIAVDDQIAILTYRLSGDTIRLIHTAVPRELEGRGYASRLAHAALERARREHLRVAPICPFVRAYLKRHPEYASLVRPDD
jgi:uncharacterized protein